MANRSVWIILICIMLTTIITVVNSGCSNEYQVMDGVNNMKITNPTIPPIDTVVPVKTETATFALG
jgi:hypothetical protein